MRDPLEPSSRCGDGRSGVRSRGGGPARRRSPSRARVLGSGLGFVAQQGAWCVQVPNEPKQGLCEAVRRCRVSAMAERWRRNAGVRCPAN